MAETQADPSLFARKVGETSLFEHFRKQGIPEEALIRSFEFLDENKGKTLNVAKKLRPRDKAPFMSTVPLTVQAQTTAILDFSRPSTEKRLYLLNLTTGKVTKYYSAHGRNSGLLMATKFSNLNMSKMSSLGLYLAGSTYHGGHGKSMNLHGLEPSNDLAAERDIVMHAAPYISEDFIQRRGRLGLSWGCPAVEPQHLDQLISSLGNGSLLYFYHPKLMEEAQINPKNQILK